MQQRLVILIFLSYCAFQVYSQFNSRPEPFQRKFVSPIIDSVIETVKSKISNKNLSTLFENSFPNTLDTTISYYTNIGDPDTYVITGDINAMWLRDSTNQVLTYADYYNQDPALKLMVRGVINRQMNYTLLDPYANAFNFDEEGSEWESDHTTKSIFGVNIQFMMPQLHERKFEIDSISSVIRLQNVYYNKTQDNTLFNFKYFKTLNNIIKVFRLMQRDHDEEYQSGKIAYTFSRDSSQTYETTTHSRGEPTKRCGLIRTFFRPSDDGTVFQFNIPINAYVSSVLKDASQILQNVTKIPYLLSIQAQYFSLLSGNFADEIKNAIYTYGINKAGNYFYYEVDGFGNGYFADDANQPSLLSMPLHGFIDINDITYQNTRKRVLSKDNPYYFVGKEASGIGGPHIGQYYIWPMSLITQAMTSNNQTEILYCLETLTRTTADTFFIHESFHKDNQYSFTRDWFAWANGLFGELVLQVYKTNISILHQDQSINILIGQA